MEFPRKEHWNGLPFPPPGDFPEPGMESGSPALLADSLPSELSGYIFPLLRRFGYCWNEVKGPLLHQPWDQYLLLLVFYLAPSVPPPWRAWLSDRNSSSSQLFGWSSRAPVPWGTKGWVEGGSGTLSLGRGFPAQTHRRAVRTRPGSLLSRAPHAWEQIVPALQSTTPQMGFSC